VRSRVVFCLKIVIHYYSDDDDEYDEQICCNKGLRTLCASVQVL
jgi:hypothetical protein